MSGLRIAAFIAVIFALALIAGCGGGGGGSSSTPPPVTETEGTITGTVIGSVNKTGVANVMVWLASDYWAVTDNKGQFKIEIGQKTDLPDHFEVQTSSAGSNYPTSGFVTYNGQTYFPNWVDMPISVLNGETTSLGTITIYEDIDGSSVPQPPYPSKDTVIVGRVVAQSKVGVASITNPGIANVSVSFGTPAVNTVTGKYGYFAVNLGRDVDVIERFPMSSWVMIGSSLVPVFSISTSTATGYPSTLEVSFNNVTGSQGAIILPSDVLTGGTTSLGTIMVLDGDNTGGGDGPPPPPTF